MSTDLSPTSAPDLSNWSREQLLVLLRIQQTQIEHLQQDLKTALSGYRDLLRHQQGALGLTPPDQPR